MFSVLGFGDAICLGVTIQLAANEEFGGLLHHIVILEVLLKITHAWLLNVW